LLSSQKKPLVSINYPNDQPLIRNNSLLIPEVISQLYIVMMHKKERCGKYEKLSSCSNVL